MARLKASTFFDLHRLLGDRQSMKIGNNTTAEREGDLLTPMIVVRLHGHEIVRLTSESVSVSLAGYGTVTTRERVNHFLQPHGYYVAQRSFVQVLGERGGDERPIGSTEWITVA